MARRTYRFRKYQCTKGHVHEILVCNDNLFEKRSCPQHGCRRRAYLKSLVDTHNALPKATVVFEKLVNGRVERMYPGDANDPVAIQKARELGYERREIQGIGDIRRFEREVRRELESQHSAMNEHDDRIMGEIRAEQRAALRDEMKHMAGIERDIAEYALRQSESGYSQRYDSEFRVGAFN